MENQCWNEWRFQIHWNNIEQVNPRNLSEGKNHFCFSYKTFYLKDNNKYLHQVGDSKLKLLDLGEFYKRKIIINELEASLNGTTI